MTFLPIVERELRVRARQKATFRARLGAALAACLIIAFFLFTSGASPAGMGKAVFWFVSVLAFIWCLFEGPRNTADALSEEKREGTLGLLFLTDLKGYDVVLGKLLATSLNSFYGVLAIVPPLSIPLLLGGVTVGEFWRMVLVLLVTLVFSLSASLFISANSRNERRAWVASMFLIVFLAAVPPLFRWVPLPSAALLGAVSPTPALCSLHDALFARQPQAFWNSILGVQALTWGFLIAACLVLPRSWQDKPVQRANREVALAHRKHSVAERQRQMDLHPVVWMLTRGKRAEWYVWAAVACYVVPSMAIAIVWNDIRALMFPLLGAAFVLNFLLAVWVAARACFMISDARSSGALDLLLTTPITPREIVDGHADALRRQFKIPFAALSISEVVIAAILDMRAEGVALAPVITCVAAAITGAQLLAVGWFGLWAGLTTKKSAHAVVKTILWVLVLPTATLLFCACLFPIVFLVKDAIFIHYAQSRLRTHFRTILTEGLTAKAGEWPRPKGESLVS
jgi:ABC-type transport system involved in multi-copper enzyme maturation permease subunit